MSLLEQVIKYFAINAVSWIGTYMTVPLPDYVRDSCSSIKNNDNFDFIVVGAGSAGAVVARRLAEVSSWKVLLIEAGDDPQVAMQVPYSVVTPLSNVQTWGWNNEPSDSACRGMVGGKCQFLRQKSLGGCSSNNYMMYVRGSKQDYADWSDVGNEGWTYDDVLPFFKKSENFIAGPIGKTENNSTVSDKYHSKGGPLTVNRYSASKSITNMGIRAAFITANKNLGYPVNIDYNGESQIGFSDYYATVDKDGYRQNTAKAYLVKVPKNLRVCKNSLVDKVVIENKTAVGVTFKYKDEETKTVRARKEVILSAGAFNSPGILERSGIGDRRVLEKIGIETIHALPGVGNNIQDHMYFLGDLYVADFSVNGPENPMSLQLSGTGGFLDTLNNSSVPDIQYILLESLAWVIPIYSGIRLKLSYYIQYIMEAFRTKKNFLFTIAPVVLRTDVRNNIHITSKDPSVEPKYRIKHFSSEQEVKTMLRGIRYAEKLLKDPAFEKYNITRIPLKPCSKSKLWSDEYYTCLMKEVAQTLYHVCGSCMMGPQSNRMAVVNDKLQVHGIKNLRVADASIFPNITRGNTNAPSIMVGERAADFIKTAYKA